MSLWANRFAHAVCRGPGQACRRFPQFPSRNKAREMARQVAQPLFVLCRALSRETRAPHGAPSRASSFTAPGRALRGPSVSPAGLRVFLGKAKRRAIGPRGHAPGRRLVLAVGRSSRRRPGAGEASSPGSGRRIRSHPLDTCESALWRTALGIISYRIKVKCAPPMTGQARA